MAKAQICLPLIVLLYILSGSFMSVNAQSQGKWCVAKPGTSNEQLLINLNTACATANLDCQYVSSNTSACNTPNNFHNLASVAMNLYYQSQGRHFYNCDFAGTAIIALTDPSFGGCIYEFRQ